MALALALMEASLDAPTPDDIRCNLATRPAAVRIAAAWLGFSSCACMVSWDTAGLETACPEYHECHIWQKGLVAVVVS